MINENLEHNTKELSIKQSANLILDIILGGSYNTNPIADNTGITLRNSKDKQEHVKLRIIEKLMEWEEQGYKIIKIETEQNKDQ